MLSHMSAPRVCVYICAALIAGSLSYGLLRMPLQVLDSLDEIIEVRQLPGVRASFTATIGQSAYFRPLRFAEDKVLMEAFGTHYFAAFKTFHVALLISAFALFLGALPVATGAECAAALFALTVFAGLHTFIGLVKEGYPINHFLQIVVLTLVAFHLARSRGGWLIDAAAVLTFVAACLTLESGILVWVVIATSRLRGRRGVSDAALAALTALLGGYILVRFVWLSPNLRAMGNASGYWFERLERPEIPVRFGEGLTRFNVYNVIVSMVSVLFSEPRSGVFVFLRAGSLGDVPPRMWINVVSSSITTVFIGMTSWRLFTARAAWRRRRPESSASPSSAAVSADGTTALVVFGAVLVASGVTSYAYAKDEIMSVAGVFYALAAFWAVRDLLVRPLRAAPAAVVALYFSWRPVAGRRGRLA